MSLSELGQAALHYARMGHWHVFPLQARRKDPLPTFVDGAPYCTNGRGEGAELLGTRDPDRIEEWWRRWPDANIGAALRYGPLFVLDVDARNGGHHTLDAIVDADEALSTLTSVSGSGWPSRHLWFVRNSHLDANGVTCTSIGAGLDLKGHPLGYVVLPPSVHPCGDAYYWHDLAGDLPVDEEVELCPDWLVDRILLVGEVRGRGGRVIDCASPDMFPRGLELVRGGWYVGAKLGPGKWLSRCPNEAQHTTGRRRRKDSSCVLLAPSRPGGRGRLFCSHSHCAHVR